MPDLYLQFKVESRSLVDRSRHYAGQQCDSGSTTLHFTYDPINFLDSEDVTPYIIFDVTDDEGNPLTYGPNSTPRFDGYTFTLPWDLTSRVKRSRIEYQLWFVRNNVTIDDTTQIPHLDSTDYILSSIGGIALKPSVVNRCKPCSPCKPSAPTTEPTLMGLMDIVLGNAAMLPVRMDEADDGRIRLTFNTYYGEKSQSITLDVPSLTEDGTVDERFLPIIRSWFSPTGEFLPTANNIASANLVYAALSEKSDKAMPVVTWSADSNYSIGALVLDGAGRLYRAIASSKGIQPSDPQYWVRVLDESDIPDPPEPGTGEEPSDDAILDYGYIKTLLAQKLDKASVVTEWSEEPTDDTVPSAKLVLDSFETLRTYTDAMVADEWQDPLPTDIAPSQRLVDDALKAKTDKTMAIPEWDADTEYPYQAVVVYEGVLYISNINSNRDKVPVAEDVWWTPVTSTQGGGSGGGSGGTGTPLAATFVSIIGNGTDTSFDIEHNLNTENVTVELRTSDGRLYVRSTITVLDEKTVRVEFRHPPADKSITVLIASYIASPNSMVVTLGDGVSTSFEIEHNFGTYNVFAQFRDARSGLLFYADVTAVSPSAIRADFAMPPDPDSVVLCLAPCIPQSSIEGYVHTQSVAADTWVINHGLNRIVAVYITDLDGEEQDAWVKQDLATLNTVTVRFSEPVAGIAVLR